MFEQGGGEPPVMTIQLNYTDHNKTRAPSRPLDTGYKKIDSFDLIEDLEKLLEGIKVSENGSFVRKMTQESKRSSYSDATLIMSEDSQVSYETKDKKLTFTANAQTKVPSAYEGALETVLEYADGTLVSTDPVNGKVSAQQSEEDARAFINSLMIPDAFDRDLLTDISFNGNAYIVRGTPSNTLTFRQELGAAGANVTDATYHANISVRDGKVTKILITLTYVFSSDRMVYTYDITYN